MVNRRRDFRDLEHRFENDPCLDFPLSPSPFQMLSSPTTLDL